MVGCVLSFFVAVRRSDGTCLEWVSQEDDCHKDHMLFASASDPQHML